MAPLMVADVERMRADNAIELRHHERELHHPLPFHVSGSEPTLQRVVARVHVWILPPISGTLRLISVLPSQLGQCREESLPVCLESKLPILYTRREGILKRFRDFIFDLPQIR
jgi:hypothetical protein